TDRNQRPPLPHGGGRQRHGRQLAQRVELRQPQRVVLVGLAFEVLELPGLAGGGGDQTAQAEFGTAVGHPAGQQAGLDEDHGGPVPAQQSVQFAPCRLEAGEAEGARGLVVDTGDALVLAQVDGQNGVGGGRGGGRGRRHRASSGGGSWWLGD